MAKYLVQHRRGSASQWAEKNTIIPKEGEIVIEIDEENSLHKLKIGDGIHTYAELAYLQAGDEVVTQVLAKALPRIITINLNKDAWESVQYKDNPNLTCYKQTIPIDGVTSRTKLNLQPDAIMLAEFQKLNLVFVAENEIDGTTHENEITVYSIGDKPTDSYTMQATIVEADIQDGQNKVVGIPVGTPIAQTDWNQTDETKSDYIKNKPMEKGEGENSIEGQGATALADYSIAFGENSIAGCKAYYIKSIDLENKKIYLTNEQIIPTIEASDNTDINFETPGYEAGEQFSIKNDNHHNYCGTIVSVSNNVVTYSEDSLGFAEILTNNGLADMDNYSFRVPTKPNIGSTIITKYNYAEGRSNYATGSYSHAEGYGTNSDGNFSHTEGRETKAAYAAHAEGRDTIARGNYSHAEGQNTQSNGVASHTEGQSVVVNGLASHGEGANNTVHAMYSHTEGYGNTTEKTANYSHNEGKGNTVSGEFAHVEGTNSKATGNGSHAEGTSCQATAGNAHSEGTATVSSGEAAHAEGNATSASGNAAHSEGQGTVASGSQAHAEGYKSKATYQAAHAEGYCTQATKIGAHAEGSSTEATGDGSHAEGYDTVASGPYAHAEGSGTTAKSFVTHAEGQGTIARGNAQHVQGKYNIEDTSSRYSHIIGNGTSEARKNIHTVDWNGNAWFSGDVKVGGSSQDSGVALAKSDLSNIDNTAFKAKAEEAGINGCADFMSNGVFMIIKGVVSALPDTAKDGDFYILDKWNKVGTYNNNDGMALYSNGFSFSVWNSMSNTIYEHIQKNYNGKYRFTIDGKTYSYTDCTINGASDEGLSISGQTLNLTEYITVTNGTIVEVYSLTEDEVSEKKKYVYYNGEWIDM